MKILMTGSTASQVPNRRTETTLTFSKLLNKALIDGKNDVTWVDPSVSLSKDYLAEFDSVVVGISPPTSTAAYRIYGALSVIYYAQELGNLTLVVDAPEPKRLYTGIKAIYNNPSSLVKDFYSKRQEYRKIDEETLKRLSSAIEYLHTEKWPTTIFPVLPWMSFPSVSSSISNTDSSNLVGLNFDSYLLGDQENREAPYRSYEDFWLVDNINTKWSKSIESTLAYELLPAKKTRWEGDESIDIRLSKALGTLISLHQQGSPWWSVLLAKSLRVGVPVATDWRLSSMLGSSWSVLPSAIEDLSESERSNLAYEQKISYLNAVPSKKNSIELVTNAVSRK